MDEHSPVSVAAQQVQVLSGVHTPMGELKGASVPLRSVRNKQILVVRGTHPVCGTFSPEGVRPLIDLKGRKRVAPILNTPSIPICSEIW